MAPKGVKIVQIDSASAGACESVKIHWDEVFLWGAFEVENYWTFDV